MHSRKRKLSPAAVLVFSRVVDAGSATLARDCLLAVAAKDRAALSFELDRCYSSMVMRMCACALCFMGLGGDFQTRHLEANLKSHPFSKRHVGDPAMD